MLTEFEKLNDFVDFLITETKLDAFSIVQNYNIDDNDDLIWTFYTFLIVRCMLRIDPSYASGNIFVLTKLGKSNMNDKKKRTKLIESFLKLYKYEACN